MVDTRPLINSVTFGDKLATFNLYYGGTGGVFVGPSGSANLFLQANGSEGFIRTINNGNLNFGTNGINRWAVTSNEIRPTVDNVYGFGAGSFRATVIYAATGTINTSDETEKLWHGPGDDLEIAMAISDELGYFQWLDAIEEKGPDGARMHFGVRAQRVWTILSDAGRCAPLVDGLPDPDWDGPPPPAYLCYDELEEGGGRFGLRVDQLNLFLNWAMHERLKLLEG